jgi:hypothetical protein
MTHHGGVVRSAMVYESYLRMKVLLGTMNLSKTNNE